MCYSQAEGGLRCPSATVPRVNKALAEFRQAQAVARAAKAAGSPESEELDLAAAYKFEELTRAFGDYAAHPDGQAHVEQQLGALDDPNSKLATMYRRALSRGESLRLRAEAVRNANRWRAENAAENAAARAATYGPTAKELVAQHELEQGEQVTIVWGGSKKFSDTGVFHGLKRGGQANHGLLLIENGEGRVLEHDAAGIIEVRKGE